MGYKAQDSELQGMPRTQRQKKGVRLIRRESERLSPQVPNFHE